MQDNTHIFINNIQNLQGQVEKYVGAIDTQVRRCRALVWGLAGVMNRGCSRSSIMLGRKTRDPGSPPGVHIDLQVEKLEQEKLKAVGLRNKVAALSEVRGPCMSM